MPGNIMAREAAIIDSREGQLGIKDDFQRLFVNAFGRPMTDREWEHFYLNCPAGQTVSFVYYESGEMIAHGGLIPQRLVSGDGEKIGYFLQTAIMVHEKYQTLHLFKDLLDTMGRYVIDRKSFAVAYPNKNTYLPFVRMLGWRMVREYNIEQYLLREGSPAQDLLIPGGDDFEFELYKDSSFMKWRAEINGMKCLAGDGYTVIYKDYGGCLELLDVSVKKSGSRIPVGDAARIPGYERVNIAGCFSGQVSLKGLSPVSAVGIPQRMCFYPATHPGCRYESIRPSLLISDVF